MSAPILFFGTSFLGAIKQAYDAMFPKSDGASFLGFNAPNLAANLKEGWGVSDGRLQFAPELDCFVSGFEQCRKQVTVSKTFPGASKVTGFQIDLRRYRTIVFVDMFYRLQPTFSINEDFYPSVDGCPVSDGLLAELQINGFCGWISLDEHPQFGSIPFVNSILLLNAIRNAAASASVFLLSAPRPPVGNLDIQARYGDVNAARRAFDLLERLYARQLAECGIEYLDQPLEILDHDGCLTRPSYSRGAHPTKSGFADPHMNIQYGEAILTKYAGKITERF